MGPSTNRRRGSLWAVALLVLGLVGARAEAKDYFVVKQLLNINFPANPARQTGWVTSTDTGTFLVYLYVPMTVTCSTGSDMGLSGYTGSVPLEVGTRVVGKGTWSNGAPFDTGGLWSSWGDWTPSGGSTTVRFDAAQTCGIGLRARAYRNGMGDPSGTWRQSTPVTITLIPTS